MKLKQHLKTANRSSGSAVVIVIALIALMLVFVTANLRSISNFGRELKLLENRQVRRITHSQAVTHKIPPATPETKTP